MAKTLAEDAAHFRTGLRNFAGKLSDYRPFAIQYFPPTRSDPHLQWIARRERGDGAMHWIARMPVPREAQKDVA